MKINTTIMICNMVVSALAGLGYYHFGNILGVSFPSKLLCSLGISSLIGMLLLSFELNQKEEKQK